MTWNHIPHNYECNISLQLTNHERKMQEKWRIKQKGKKRKYFKKLDKLAFPYPHHLSKGVVFTCYRHFLRLNWAAVTCPDHFPKRVKCKRQSGYFLKFGHVLFLIDMLSKIRRFLALKLTAVTTAPCYSKCLRFSSPLLSPECIWRRWEMAARGEVTITWQAKNTETLIC